MQEITGNQKETPKASKAELDKEEEEEQRPFLATDDPQPAIDEEEPTAPNLDPGTGSRGRRGKRRGTGCDVPVFPYLSTRPTHYWEAYRRTKSILFAYGSRICGIKML